jgi:hypothetical protein
MPRRDVRRDTLRQGNVKFFGCPVFERQGLNAARSWCDHY